MPGPSENRWSTISGMASGKFARDWRIGLRGRCSPSWRKKSSCSTASLRNSRKPRKKSWIWRRNVRDNICITMNNRTHRGSDFRAFLKEEGILEESDARALKQAVALQLARLLKQK